jgi:4-hydroxybenzoate polyprenyltransferase
MSAAALDYRVYLRLGRISNLPTVWSNVLAGAALAGGGTFEQLLLLALGASLLYTGGMFLNDAFDRDIDARERPERPIPSGRVSPGRVFLLGYGMLAAGVLVVALPALGPRGGGWPGVAAAIVLALLITVYDAWHKGNPVSPVIMGGCRALVYVTAALAVAGVPGLVLSGEPGPSVTGGAVVLLLYIVGLTCLAQQENLAHVRNWWPLAALAAPFVYLAPGLGDAGPTLYLPPGLADADPTLGLAPGLAGADRSLDLAPGLARVHPALYFYLVFLGWTVYTVALLARRKPQGIRRAVVGLIAGVSLLDALLIAATGAFGLAVLAALGFVLTLMLQRLAPGT